jgi:hypothetical protein
MSEINSISVNEMFWVRFESNSINLDFKGLPQNVHFTISFNPKSPDVNFHITRNNGTQNDKPKIEILRINKRILEEDAEKLGLVLLGKALEEIPFSEIESAYFFPFGDENSNNRKLIQNKLEEKFKDNMHIKRRGKLKIIGELESKFQEFATDTELLETILDDVVPIEEASVEHIQGGVLMIDSLEIPVIRIHNKFYRMKQLTPDEFLSVFFNPNVYNRLLPMIKKAIIRVKNLNSWAETQPYSKSIRLVRSSIHKVGHYEECNEPTIN